MQYKSIITLFSSMLASSISMGQLYPAFKELPSQPGIKKSYLYGNVGNDLYAATETVSSSPSYMEYKANYYNGTAWSSLPVAKYKGSGTQLFLLDTTIYLAGNFKEINGIKPNSGRFFLFMQLKGNTWDTVWNADVPDSLANSKIRCIKTGFYLLHSKNTSFGSLHKFLPGLGIVKNYPIVLEPNYKNLKRFEMVGAGNTIMVYGNIIKLDGNTLSRFYFTLFKDSVKTPTLTGSGVPVAAAVDFNDDIYSVLEFSPGISKHSKGVNTNIKYNLMLTMLGVISARNGEVLLTPGKQMPNYTTYDWYLPNNSNYWYVALMNVGNYGIAVSEKQGIFCIDIANGIWKYMSSEPGAVVKGKCYADLNKNCVFEAGKDTLLPKTAVSLETSNSSYTAITDNDGNYSMVVPIDSFLIQSNKAEFQLNSCTKKFIKTDSGRTDTVNVALFPKYANNLLVRIVTGNRVRLDASHTYQIMAKNLGVTSRNAKLILLYNPKAVLVLANGSSVSSAGKVEWSISGLHPLQQRFFEVTLSIPFDSFSLGDTFCMHAILDTATGEDVLSDNLDSICQKVVYSYDPNSKECNAEGEVPLSVNNFTYTIHFQNEGNDYAQNVLILDTLQTTLDAEGLTFLTSSHPCKMTLSGRVLSFSFPNIMLQAKSVNEPLSKGFVSFSIPRNSNLTPGNKIENKAHIYFDRNAPVQTNTATTVLRGFASVNDVLVQSQKPIVTYPNPTEELLHISAAHMQNKVVTIYNLQGKIMWTGKIDGNGKTQCNLTAFASGIYILECEGISTKVCKK